jgi:hypothetical protein
MLEELSHDCHRKGAPTWNTSGLQRRRPPETKAVFATGKSVINVKAAERTRQEQLSASVLMGLGR